MSDMKNLTIYASDKIRMHPNAITVDGLGIAVEPFLILPLDASDEKLGEAIRECLERSESDVPHRPWEEEGTEAYYENLGVKSRKDLGPGVDITWENGVFTVTPIDMKGMFGDPAEVEEGMLVETVRRCFEKQ
jgi:hypothetical protein